MATEPEEDDMSTEKKKGKRHLRAVNPKDPVPQQPLLDAAARKQIIISLITTGAVVGGVALAQWAYRTYGAPSKNPPDQKPMPNPLLPGNVTTPTAFQSPYAQMPMPAPMQAMPNTQMTAHPVAALQAPASDEPPAWFSAWAENMETRLTKVEKKKSKPLRKKIEDYEDED